MTRIKYLAGSWAIEKGAAPDILLTCSSVVVCKVDIDGRLTHYPRSGPAHVDRVEALIVAWRERQAPDCPAKEKVKVPERALLQRINRALKPQGDQVKKCRDGRQSNELGRYYCIDINGGCILDKDVDLEQLGKELEVLNPYEEVLNDPPDRLDKL